MQRGSVSASYCIAVAACYLYGLFTALMLGSHTLHTHIQHIEITRQRVVLMHRTLRPVHPLNTALHIAHNDTKGRTATLLPTSTQTGANLPRPQHKIALPMRQNVPHSQSTPPPPSYQGFSSQRQRLQQYSQVTLTTKALPCASMRERMAYHLTVKRQHTHAVDRSRANTLTRRRRMSGLLPPPRKAAPFQETTTQACCCSHSCLEQPVHMQGCCGDKHKDTSTRLLLMCAV